MRRIWFIWNVCITASQMNWVVMATAVSLILKAAGSSFSHFYLMKLGSLRTSCLSKVKQKLLSFCGSEQWLIGPFKLPAAGPQNHVKQEKMEVCIQFSIAIYEDWQHFSDTRNPKVAEASWTTIQSSFCHQTNFQCQENKTLFFFWLYNCLLYVVFHHTS